MLELKNVKKSYWAGNQSLKVLQGIDFSLMEGETIALTGESGSGKSTLLHLIAGLDQPEEGNIIFDGKDLTSLSEQDLADIRRRKIGIVFQNFNLITSLDVKANLAFQAKLSGTWDPLFLEDLAEKLDLNECLSRYPEQLSGGQQQRVAIGRALALRPKLLLADEPTGNLDENTADAVLALMLALVAETNTALFMVTHSLRVARRLSRHLHLYAGFLKC